MLFLYRATSLLKQGCLGANGAVRSFSTFQLLSSRSSSAINFNKDIIIRNVDEKQSSPLVVIVGWSNSKNKQIAKYSEIYEKEGCTTVSVSCQLYRFSMFYDTLFAKDTQNCIDALFTQRNLNKNRKVFFQLFSTPGPAMYVNIMNYYYQYIQQHFGTMSYQIKSDDVTPNICGLIYDSPTVASGNAQQFANGMRGNSTGVMTNALFDILGKIVYAYAVRTSKMHKYGPEFLKNIPINLPQLFLSSKADKIAGLQSILDFVEHQKSIGVPLLKSQVWEDSEHVLHYRNYPEEYENLVRSFVKDCISISDNIEDSPSDTEDEETAKMQY